MPIYRLSSKLIFPDPEEAEDGLLAVGGDLSVDRLKLAYSNGIFPWYSAASPILWWSLDPRMVLYPEQFVVSPSLQRKINSKQFIVRIDTCFADVISNCRKSKRKEQDGTWITNEMQEAYINMHQEGYAHSVEVFFNNELVGGLYGISLGAAFFGESMFYIMTDASKVALAFLVNKLKSWDFELIDAQQSTDHLKSFGAIEIPRKLFLSQLHKSLERPTVKGRWTNC